MKSDGNILTSLTISTHNKLNTKVGQGTLGWLHDTSIYTSPHINITNHGLQEYIIRFRMIHLFNHQNHISSLPAWHYWNFGNARSVQDASWVQLHKSGLDRIIIAKGVARVITSYCIDSFTCPQLQMRLAEGIRLKHAMSSWESHSCEFFGGGVVVVLIMVAIHQRAWGWLEPGTCFTQHIYQNSKLLWCNHM